MNTCQQYIHTERAHRIIEDEKTNSPKNRIKSEVSVQKFKHSVSKVAKLNQFQNETRQETNIVVIVHKLFHKVNKKLTL